MTTVPASFIQFPPANTTIPAPPRGFVPGKGGGLRRVAPRKLEMVALPAAVTDLQQFGDYTATFGKTAPPIEQVIQMFDAARQWSTMRRAMDAWDAYCRAQEEIAWAGVRIMMARLTPSFALATHTDPGLAEKYPNLATLLTARKLIARKGIGTRALNAKDKAEGKPPSHGATGKRLQRARQRAALVAAMAKLAGGPASGAGGSGTPGGAASTGVGSGGVVTTGSPTATSDATGGTADPLTGGGGSTP